MGAKTKYPLIYQCLRPDCEEVLDGLRKAKAHVHQDHGIAWKQTRKWLRVMGIHEPLPELELLPTEKKVKKARERKCPPRVYERKRPFIDDVFAIGNNFARFSRSKGRSAKKPRERIGTPTSNLIKTKIEKKSVYKGYLSICSILGVI